MKQFTQEQAQAMYAAIQLTIAMLENTTTDDFSKGADNPFRDALAAALAHTDDHPVAAPLSSLGNCDTCAFLSSRVFDEPCDSCSTETTPWSGWQPEIVTINLLDAMEMEEQAGITAADELLSAQIAGEGVAE